MVTRFMAYDGSFVTCTYRVSSVLYQSSEVSRRLMSWLYFQDA